LVAYSGFLFKNNYLDGKELDEYGVYTVGEIYEFWRDGRANPRTCFRYYVTNDEYKGCSSYVINDGNHGIGKKILVYYSSKNPATIRFYFDIIFPDTTELGKVIDWDWETRSIRE
jgi:hypothetical protein